MKKSFTIPELTPLQREF